MTQERSFRGQDLAGASFEDVDLRGASFRLVDLSDARMHNTYLPRARLTVSVAKVRPFITTADWRPTLLTDRADLRALVAPRVQQLELFAA